MIRVLIAILLAAAFVTAAVREVTRVHAARTDLRPALATTTEGGSR